jgi:hypothetical protein
MAPQAVPQAPVPSRKKRPIVLIIILLFVLCGIFTGIGSCVATCKADTERTALMNSEIAIPDLIGMSPLDAENKVRSVSGGYASNWSVVFTIEGDPTGELAYKLRDQGYVVVSQNPAAGEKRLGSEVAKVTLDLAVSAGFVPESDAQDEQPDTQSEQPDAGVDEKSASTASDSESPASPAADPLSDPNNSETRQSIETAIKVYLSSVYPTYTFVNLESVEYRSDAQKALGGEVLYSNAGLDVFFDFVYFWDDGHAVAQIKDYDSGVLAVVDRSNVFFDALMPDRQRI